LQEGEDRKNLSSKAIKVHTPGGGVHVFGSGRGHRTAMPLPEFDAAGVEEEGSAAEEAANKRQLDERTPARATDEIEERLREEFKAGFDEGRRHAEGTLAEEFHRKEAELSERVETLLGNIIRQYHQFQSAAERNAVQLAVAIAERIVKKAVTIDDEFVLRQIHEAMKRVVGVDRIRIRLNPADEEFVRAHRPALLTSADAVRELTLESDETIPRGSCMLESDAGNVDASIATQLERVEAALFSDQEAR